MFAHSTNMKSSYYVLTSLMKTFTDEQTKGARLVDQKQTVDK